MNDNLKNARNIKALLDGGSRHTADTLIDILSIEAHTLHADRDSLRARVERLRSVMGEVIKEAMSSRSIEPFWVMDLREALAADDSAAKEGGG